MQLTNWLSEVTHNWDRIRKDRATRKHSQWAKRRERATGPEQLEPRELLSVTAIVVQNELYITAGVNDSVTVRTAVGNPAPVEVLGNGVKVFGAGNVAASSLGRIRIEAGDGNNTIDLSAVTAARFSASLQVIVSGGNGNDTVIGSPDLAISVLGGDGADTVTGGTGKDTIDGGNGNDSLLGGTGDDVLKGGDGRDSLDGGNGNDSLLGGDGKDTLLGVAGNDTLDGGADTDDVRGGTGDDSLLGGSGIDTVNGEDGNDSVFGGFDADSLLGGNGNDTLNGEGGNDTVSGEAGNDVLLGGNGANSLLGGTGNDHITGDSGNDTAIGNDGNDSIYGGSGNDSLFGDSSDTLQIGTGSDVVRGNAGNDTLLGGGGRDSLYGDEGNDLVQSGDTDTERYLVLTLGDVSQAEGNVGTTVFNFQLVLSGPAPSPFTVNLATTDGTASSTSDFVARSGSVQFNRGDVSQTFAVTVNGDTGREATESFTVSILSVSRALTVARTTATGTIQDDEIGTPILNVAGTGSATAGPLSPPDTIGEIGRNHYIQMTNGFGGSVVQIFNKADGSQAFPAFNLPQLAPAGSNGARFGAGDPVVFYDHLADRWLLMEFSNPGNALFIYISRTSTPTNNAADWVYWEVPTPRFPDYPKITLWNDAYFIGTNEFDPAGETGYALDRTAMLAGNGGIINPIRLTIPARPNWRRSHVMPADIDGPAAPAGAPGIFVRQVDDEITNPGTANPNQDFLEVFEFRTDFANPGNSSFTQVARLSIAEFSYDIANFQRTAIPQQGTAQRLDAIPHYIMWRLQYRNFGSYETLVGNFTADVDGNDHVGIRWFELRKTTGGTWQVRQDGTVAPDAEHRWMGSIAMDADGNIALGYSISSNSRVPAIAYTGRSASDPLGVMTQPEVIAHSGTGAQTVSPRWGDYSSMSIDPVDGRTFWYTTEVGNGFLWDTRVINFRFAPVTSSNGGGAAAFAPSLGDLLVGGTGNDTLLGTDGDDSLNGEDGDDSLLGGAGDDVLTASGGSDFTDAGSGEDTVNGGSGTNTLGGGADSDTLVLQPFATGTSNGGGTISTDGADKVLILGTDGNDTFTISQSGSLLRIATTRATITLAESVRAVTISGGAGNDVFNVSDLNRIAPVGIVFDLGDGNDRFNANNAKPQRVPLQVLGGNDNDTLIGTAGADYLFGGDGNDSITANDGDDTVKGDVGNDTIIGGKGNDNIQGQSGLDSITGDDGNDTLSGGEDNDVLNGFAGNDLITGEDGNDTLFGGTGNDRIEGGTGNDTIRGHEGNDLLLGGDGNDTLRGEAGNDTINAGDGDDTVDAGDGNDLATGGNGNDTIDGGLGNDTLLGDDGNDVITGGMGNDTLLGDDGDDTLSGGGATDKVAGGDGTNNLSGNASNEIDETFVLSSALIALLNPI